MVNIIELNNIHKTYYDVIETQALHGVNLTFEEGSYSSIIGQSGSGKSTLMNIIGTLDLPTSGDVNICGVRIDTLNKDELARLRNELIGFVFQFHYLLPEYTVLENVLMPSYIKYGRTTKKDSARAMELLELVGIGNKADTLSTNISGGQQQRTAIARALMNNPKILLADEPTGNLDTETSAKIEKLFIDLNKETGNTVIVVTHDERVAEKAHRVIEVRDGMVFRDLRNLAR